MFWEVFFDILLGYYVVMCLVVLKGYYDVIKFKCKVVVVIYVLVVGE